MPEVGFSSELEALAAAAADTLVSAMATDAWQAVKKRFGRAIGHERLMERDRDLLVQQAPDLDGRARWEYRQAWTRRLLDEMVDRPDLEQSLRNLINQKTPTAPVMIQQGVAGTSNIVVTGGRDAILDQRVDRRKYFSAPWAWFLSVGKTTVAHPVVGTIVVAAFVGTAAVGGVVAHNAATSKPASKSRPSPSDSAVEQDGPSPLLLAATDIGPDWTAIAIVRPVAIGYGGPACNVFMTSAFLPGADPIGNTFTMAKRYLTESNGGYFGEDWLLNEREWNDPMAAQDLSSASAACETEGLKGSTISSDLAVPGAVWVIGETNDDSQVNPGTAENDFDIYGYSGSRAFWIGLDIRLSQNDPNYAAIAPIFAEHLPSLAFPENSALLDNLTRRAVQLLQPK